MIVQKVNFLIHWIHHKFIIFVISINNFHVIFQFLSLKYLSLMPIEN